jgi:hypothetical protein
MKTVQTVTQTTEAQRQALIDRLCATLGTQYKGLQQYRGL